jgi:hypothetical protein
LGQRSRRIMPHCPVRSSHSRSGVAPVSVDCPVARAFPDHRPARSLGFLAAFRPDLPSSAGRIAPGPKTLCMCLLASAVPVPAPSPSDAFLAKATFGDRTGPAPGLAARCWQASFEPLRPPPVRSRPFLGRPFLRAALACSLRSGPACGGETGHLFRRLLPALLRRSFATVRRGHPGRPASSAWRRRSGTLPAEIGILPSLACPSDPLARPFGWRGPLPPDHLMTMRPHPIRAKRFRDPQACG